MATSGVANRLEQHGLQIFQSKATYIVSSGMSVIAVSVQKMKLEITCLLTSNIPGGITNNIELSPMLTPRQLLPICHHPMLGKDWKSFDIFSVLWAISPFSDLLYTMQIGMPEYLQKWIFHFVKMHGWLDKYNATWICVPDSKDLKSKIKSYEEVCQWNGKELKEMSWYLFGVVTQFLQDRSPTDCSIFNGATVCTPAS